ncbi:hypothetical protein [Fluviicola sp.]|uniref:hypothetical protein n=1 Tax=Fluviicola sp. TaxID=1917219 RepID=UPI0026078F1E|nr:hypothetical protein [Fluviicola sp.]
MQQIEISINPLAEFLEATESRKIKIIEEQLDPDPVRIPYYQKARASIVKSFMGNKNHELVKMAIEYIRQQPIKKKWHISNKAGSLEALANWMNMNLPQELLDAKLERLTTKAKFYQLYGVLIKISPSGIFRVVIDGQKYIGAFKVHISKGKPFSNKQSALVAQLLNLFLSGFVAEEDEIVDPRFCLCIDPFAQSVITASHKIRYDVRQLKTACSEINHIWNNSGNKNLGVA